jgi:hypothetical protein
MGFDKVDLLDTTVRLEASCKLAELEWQDAWYIPSTYTCQGSLQYTSTSLSLCDMMVYSFMVQTSLPPCLLRKPLRIYQCNFSPPLLILYTYV